MSSLVWNRTFIDVDGERMPEAPHSGQGRALSEPRSSAGAAEIFEGERAYVAILSERFAAGAPTASPERTEHRSDCASVHESHVDESNRLVISVVLSSKVDGRPATGVDVYTREPLSIVSSSARHEQLRREGGDEVDDDDSKHGGGFSVETKTIARNTGSVGHPILCSRPCRYYNGTGGCANGVQCEFCHMPHGRRMPRLNKVHREQLRAMDVHRATTMLLERVRVKALAFDGSAETERLVDGLFHASGVLCAPRLQRSHDEQKLCSLFSGMTVRQLLIALQRSVWQRESDAQRAADALLTHLQGRAAGAEA